MADQPLANLFVEFDTKNEKALKDLLGEVRKQTETVRDGFEVLGKKSTEATDAAVKGWKVLTAEVRAAGLDRILDAINRQSDAMRTGFKDLDRASRDATDSAEKGWKRLGDQIKATGAAVVIASGHIRGLVLGGFHASQAGEIFGQVWERLSLTVAGLFTPEIQGLTLWLDKLTIKLQHMTPAQREHAAFMLQGAFAAKAAHSALLAFLPVLGPVGALLGAIAVGGAVSEKGVSGFLQEMKPLFSVMRDLGRIMADLLVPAAQSLAGLLGQLGPAIEAIANAVESLGLKSQKTTGIGALAGAAGGAYLGGTGGAIAGAAGGNFLEAKLPAFGKAIKSLFTGNEDLRLEAYDEFFGKDKGPEYTAKGNRGPLAPRGPSNLESFGAAYERIAGLTLGASSLQQQQLDAQKDARDFLQNIWESLQPAIQNFGKGGVPGFGWLFKKK